MSDSGSKEKDGVTSKRTPTTLTKLVSGVRGVMTSAQKALQSRVTPEVSIPAGVRHDSPFADRDDDRDNLARDLQSAGHGHLVHDSQLAGHDNQDQASDPKQVPLNTDLVGEQQSSGEDDEQSDESHSEGDSSFEKDTNASEQGEDSHRPITRSRTQVPLVFHGMTGGVGTVDETVKHSYSPPIEREYEDKQHDCDADPVKHENALTSLADAYEQEGAYTYYPPWTQQSSEVALTPPRGEGDPKSLASSHADESEVEQHGGQRRGGRGRYDTDFSPGKSHDRDPSPSREQLTKHPRPRFAPSPGRQDSVEQGKVNRRLDDGADKSTMHPRGSSPALVPSPKGDTKLDLPQHPVHHKQQDLHPDGVATRPKLQPGFAKRQADSVAQKSTNVVKAAVLPPPITDPTKGYPNPGSGKEKSEKSKGFIPRKRAEEDQARILQAAARMGNADLQWAFLCQLEDSQAIMNLAVERVLYLGPVCDYNAGDRVGLATQWIPDIQAYAYHLTLDTLDKVLTEILTHNRANIRQQIRERGRTGADETRAVWRAFLEEAIVPGQDVARAELWRRTTRLLTSWETELLPGYTSAASETTWDELTDMSEAELARTSNAELRRDARLARRRTKKVRTQAADDLLPGSRATTTGAGTRKTSLSGERERSLPPKDERKHRRQSPATDALHSLRAEVSQLEAEIELERLKKRAVELTATKEAEKRATAARENELVAAAGKPQRDSTPEQDQTDKIRDANSSRTRTSREHELLAGVDASRGANYDNDADSSRLSHHSTPVEGKAKDNDKSRLSDTQSVLPTAANQNPLMRRFCQTPWVDALAEYQTEESEWRAEMDAHRRRRRRRREQRRRGERDVSSSSDDDFTPAVPTSVSFKDRIKSFHKFSQPDRNQTWPDFVQQMVELLRSYRVPSEEWAGWLVDRLAGKAQGALLNLTIQQRNDWMHLIATLNAHFHIEHEMRVAEEEMLTRKQGSKESVKDFIAALQLLARKAYGSDINKRDAAIMKRLEMGLYSSSLRRTYDEVTMYPDVGLAVLIQELVRRESRDDPAKHQAYIVREKEEASATKPQQPSTRQIVKEVLAVQQAAAGAKSTGGSGASKPASWGTIPSTGAKSLRGGTHKGGGSGRPGATNDDTRIIHQPETVPVKKPDVDCWHCKVTGHPRYLCPQATTEQRQEWLQLSRALNRRPRGAKDGPGNS